jgi:hypothetical protein
MPKITAIFLKKTIAVILGTYAFQAETCSV